MVMCEICTKEEEYHTCSTCKKHVCMTCFYEQHFWTKRSKIRQINGLQQVHFTWKSSMNYLAAVNRITALIKTDQLDPKLKNESYCKTNFGAHATQVIMDALDGSKI